MIEYIKMSSIVELYNGYAFKSNDYIDSSNTLNCRMSNIRPDGSFDILYSAKYLPDEYAHKYSNYLLNDGDLIIAMTDMAGDPKILGIPTVVNTKGYNLLLNQRVGKLKIINDNFSAKYLKFALSSKRIRDYFKSFAGGGVQLNVGKKEVLNAEIVNYPVDIQSHIVTVLETIQSIITHRKQQLAKLDELIKARFVEMFGDFKTNSMGWTIAKFTEIASIDGNMTTDFEKYANYPHIGIDSIEKDTGILRGYRTVSEDNVLSGKYVFTPSHIIYSKIRPNLNKVALPDFEGVCSADAYPILPNPENCNRVFLAYVMRSSYFLDYILQFCNRTNMPKVNRKEVSGFTTPLPPLDLQNQFATFVEQTDKSKVIADQSIQNIKQTGC